LVVVSDVVRELQHILMHMAGAVPAMKRQRRSDMPRRIRLHHFYAIVVFALLVPGLSPAEESSTLNGVKVESAMPAPDAPLDMILKNPLDQEPNASFNQEEITLEKLKQMFGAKNVCGARCTSKAQCWEICGDSSTSCRQGYCIYL
jgi:hypothetical protein